MTWSYDSSLVAGSALFQLRLMTGDTDATDKLLQDEEINFIATTESGFYRQAAACCRSISGVFARRVQRQLGDLRLSSQQQYEHYKELDKTYRMRAARGDVAVFAGGLSISGKNAVEDDSDRVQPSFTRETGDIPGSQEPNRQTSLGPVVSE